MADDELKKIAEARLGRVLRGKYRLDRVLGIGGMATVYAATHRNKKRFAIKMLHPELSMREQIRTRFLREGYVANSVDHPGAVAVLDDDVAEDGSAFIVMELLHGAPLDEVASRHGGRVPLALVVSIGDALLEVLAAAHAKGVVHRDLKPANLFLTTDGRLEVLDFGIARLHDETSDASSATQTGAMLGTPAFMAPEQALGESSKVDGQTDLWATGATLFTLLTGALVHDGSNASQLLVFAATKRARSIRDLAPEVPKPIADVIDKALAFGKGDRWASAEEMRAALATGCMEATGAAPAPLPKTEKSERVTGLEETVASSKDLSGGGSGSGSGAKSGSSGGSASNGVGFEPTVDASSLEKSAKTLVLPVATTGAGMVATRTSGLGPGRVSKGMPWKGVALTALGLVLAAGGGMAYRAAKAPKVKYCLGTEYTSDGPQCVFQVGADIIGKRAAVVPRVTERDGHVTLVEGVNPAGAVDSGDSPTGNKLPFARMEVTRDEAGVVRDVIQYDRFGAIAQWAKWSEGGKRIDYVDIDGKSPRPLAGTAITTMRVTYDGQGRRVRVLYFGATGRPRADDTGVYGVDLGYGKAPLEATTFTNLGADGAPAPGLDGVTITRHSDDGGFWPDASYFDSKDRPMAVDGAHTLHLTHNEYDWTGATRLGIHGEPTTSLHQALYEVRSAWDPAKRTLEVTLFDEHGRPEEVRGMWFMALRDTFDANGRASLQEFLDGQGNRVIMKDGIAAERNTVDEHGHVTRADLLEPSGALIRGVEGFARYDAKLDVHDNKVEMRFFDEEGHATSSSEGGAVIRSTFDDRDLRLTFANFDAAEHPVATVLGFASRRDKYDRFRNLVETSYFGPDGKPVANNDGIAIERRAFDENDDNVAVSYFDADGAPTLFKSSYATQRFAYDERGLVVEETLLDVHGDPMLGKDGYASAKSTRDRNGDVVDEAYFGKRGEPILRDGGFARRKTTFDITRRPIEATLFDTAGQLAKGTGGWAVERTTYDERGLVVRVDHLDASKSPALDHDGRASLTKTWDSRGNLIEETSLDVSGKPVATPDGYATKKTAYDERDEVTQESLFGADGSPASGKAGWSVRRVRYDDFGDVVEESFTDVAHEPVVPKALSYASMRQRYDERHRLMEASYFDVRGVPANGPDGAAAVRYKRDGYGRAIETSYFDTSGGASASKDGRIVVRSKYDDAGRLTDEHFVDGSGAPHAASDGCAGHHTKYDAVGHTLEESCLDATDALALSADGWALRRTLHDAHGNGVEAATYAPDGTLRAAKDGIARRKNRFDERNLLAETTFFDASDKPTHDKRGAYAVRFTYDDGGKKTGELAVDARGVAIAPMK